MLSTTLKLAVAFLTLMSSAVVTDDTVRVDGGLISGTNGSIPSVRVFKGIPYVAPPIGELRWRPPQPVQDWNGVRRADRFAPMCTQPQRPTTGSNLHDGSQESISEDCLYLNVWTPARIGAREASLPVMVWIHGGRFEIGSSANGLYSGETLASKGVVVVSLNYRVGALGFVAHPDLTKESEHGASGNYGLLDQIAALKWVQSNIAQFGGNPNQVTIFGQSAGSMSLSALTASPLAHGLFHRVIAESGALFGLMPSRDAAEKTGVRLATSLGASSIAELRSRPADAFVGASIPFAPIVDGWVLPENVQTIFSKGRQNDAALIVGWNANESGTAPSASAAAFTQQATKRWGGEAAAFLKAYPASDDGQARRSEAASRSDESFGWNGWTWARMQKQTGKAPSYLYHFARVPPQPDAATEGAFHGAEIYYALANLGYKKWNWTAADKALSDTMSAYWINFAKTGNPNGAGLPQWPAYDASSDMLMLFGDKVSAVKNPNPAGLQFFDAYQQRLRAGSRPPSQ
jgi:para-nitrobenzyl esterase